MTASVPSSEEALERLKRVYFNDPGREVEFRAGELVMAQGVENRRIYLVKEGALVAYRREAAAGVESLPEDSTGRSYEVFRSGPGSFVGVHAFFSGTFCSNTDVVAVEPTRLAYVDDTTPIIDEAGQGDFLHQFVPVLIHELFVRNSRIYARATEKEEALRMLSRAEMSATLAQLTAGIAHELNNAVGVITSRMQFVAEQLTYELPGRILPSLGFLSDSETTGCIFPPLANLWPSGSSYSYSHASRICHRASAFARASASPISRNHASRIGYNFSSPFVGEPPDESKIGIACAADIVSRLCVTCESVGFSRIVQAGNLFGRNRILADCLDVGSALEEVGKSLRPSIIKA